MHLSFCGIGAGFVCVVFVFVFGFEALSRSTIAHIPYYLRHRSFIILERCILALPLYTITVAALIYIQHVPRTHWPCAVFLALWPIFKCAWSVPGFYQVLSCPFHVSLRGLQVESKNPNRCTLCMKIAVKSELDRGNTGHSGRDSGCSEDRHCGFSYHLKHPYWQHSKWLKVSTISISSVPRLKKHPSCFHFSNKDWT